MSFLTLNSWVISVGVNPAAKRAPEFLGALTRQLDNSLVDSRRSMKKRGMFVTTPVKQEVAHSIEMLMSGPGKCGHHFSFNSDVWSDYLGAGPEAGYNCSIGSTGTTKFGNKLIAGVTTNTVFIEWALGLTGEWTLLYWHQSGTSGTWNHYTQRSSGNPWLNGAQTNPDVQNVLVTGGNVQFKGITPSGSTGTTQCFDDLVVLPFYLCDAAIPYFAARTTAFSDLPRLKLGGTVERQVAPADTECDVIGEWVDSTVVPLKRTVGATATWENNACEVSFNLRAA